MWNQKISKTIYRHQGVTMTNRPSLASSPYTINLIVQSLDDNYFDRLIED
jgi:hypothetical protein